MPYEKTKIHLFILSAHEMLYDHVYLVPGLNLFAEKHFKHYQYLEGETAFCTQTIFQYISASKEFKMI